MAPDARSDGEGHREHLIRLARPQCGTAAGGRSSRTWTAGL